MADVPSVYIALTNAKKAIGAVGKDERNQAQNFYYRGIDAVVNAAAPHFNEHGIIVLPEVLDYSYETVEIGQKRTPMAHVTAKVRYTFAGPAGDSVCATVISEAMDSGDKGVAKMMSVAYRIALLQVLNLPTNEPDPDGTSYERSEPAQPARKPAARNKPQAAPGGDLSQAQVLADNAAGAASVELVRVSWKAAGAAGVLQEQVAAPGSGEKMTLQEYLVKRGDELSFRGGDDGAEPAAGKGGA